jgi:cyclic pyranopterin phosphate synthase
MNEIKGIEEIYLTTNGIFLLDKIEELVKNGLKGVNISLDSLQEERFEKLTRFGQLSKVLEGIDKCLNLSVKVKLNTVLVDDINNDEIMDFVNLTFNAPIDVRFIELMPIGIGSEHKGVPNEEVMEVIKLNYKEFEEGIKNKSGGPATYIKLNGAIGKVGFISAISNCFCNECNRIRVTADGFLKQCLHFDYGVDLRELLRKGISNEVLGAVIYNNIFNKPEKHLFIEKSEHKEIRYMNEIGG